MPNPSSPQADAYEPQALMLKRDGNGQFHLTATANGSEVSFLVDTGADMVALTEGEAENLGLMLDESDFEPMAQTASGVGYGAAVTLDDLEVAGQEFHDVEAVVMRGLSTPTAILTPDPKGARPALGRGP